MAGCAAPVARFHAIESREKQRALPHVAGGRAGWHLSTGDCNGNGERHGAPRPPQDADEGPRVRTHQVQKISCPSVSSCLSRKRQRDWTRARGRNTPARPPGVESRGRPRMLHEGPKKDPVYPSHPVYPVRVSANGRVGPAARSFSVSPQSGYTKGHIRAPSPCPSSQARGGWPGLARAGPALAACRASSPGGLQKQP
jgi:hypothetical protein